MSLTILPPGLLDLTLSRFNARLILHRLSRTRTHFDRLSHRRRLHLITDGPSLATLDEAVVGQNYPSVHQIAFQKQLGKTPAFRVSEHLSELSKRVQDLQNVTAAEARQPSHQFSEEELLGLYEDLMALDMPQWRPDPSAENEASVQDDDSALMIAIGHRLRDVESLVSKNEERTVDSGHRHSVEDASLSPVPHDYGDAQNENVVLDSGFVPNHRDILSKIAAVLNRLQRIRTTVGGQNQAVHVPLLLDTEWGALVRFCVGLGDHEAAELCLELMKRSDIAPVQNVVDFVLEEYARQGLFQKIEHVMAKVLTESPTPRQRDLHVKAHIKATAVDSFPAEALSVLHSYEEQSLFAPISSYTRVICHLFSLNTSLGSTHAWDLFAHMRYVAHPTPDGLLFALMIRACAPSAGTAEPERALDLWTEMTVEQGIFPSAAAYRAIILSCVRSGRKPYIHEAFRLAKEMLDSVRDAHGNAPFKPDVRLCCALLEGAKRIGDLARTRWILAEIVRRGISDNDEQYGGMRDVVVNEEVMLHVFHAYAAYHPPLHRSAIPLQDVQPYDPDEAHSQCRPPAITASRSPDGRTGGVEESREVTGGVPISVLESPDFAQLPPQTASAAIAEVKSLFARVLEDRNVISGVTSPQATSTFSSVKLTPRLVNAYISVFYTHSSLNEARDLSSSLYGDLGLQKDAHSYVEALERCAASKKGSERAYALQWAEELWKEWTQYENHERENGRRLSARLTERAYVARIRLLALTNNLDRSVETLKTFVARFPPASISQPPPKHIFQSRKTTLSGPRPLVRLVSATEVPDDGVPPLFTFNDLEGLHHRLVAAGRQRDIGYLKYVCKAYEGALRVRRQKSLRAKPVECHSPQ